MNNSGYLSYREMQEINTSAIGSQLPISVHISLPIPTKRWPLPAYAYFVSSIGNVYDQPLRIYSPDLWWGLYAQEGYLLFYAQTSMFPFVEDIVGDYIEVPNDETSSEVAAMDQVFLHIEALMDQVVPAFFTNQPVEREIRHQLHTALLDYLAPSLHPWYQALAPDFFAWLKA